MKLPPIAGPVPKTRWQRCIEQKEAAFDAEQRKSLFLGLDMVRGMRVDIPLEALNRGHVHVQGRTGAGKTAATLLPIALQAIRGYRDETGRWSEKAPVIIFDFKGDLSLFHAVRLAAENDGRQFRFFTTQTGSGYHFFDPFQIVALRELTPIQVASSFVRALGLDYGITYGGLYFSDQNVVLLMDALTELAEADGPLTIERLAVALEVRARHSANADARHIMLCLRKLAAYPQLNLDAHDRLPPARIDMRRALEDGEVVYVFLDMDTEAPGLRAIAGLMLDALVHSAKALRRTGKRVPFTYVIADEFYHIAGQTFGELLAMAREWGLHFILANQDPAQLERHDKSLPGIVRTNTSVRQDYTVLDSRTSDDWQRSSGERIDFNRSSSTNAYDEQTNSFSEFRDWNLRNDEINEINDSSLCSLVNFDSGAASETGNRVRRVRGLFPIFRWQHELYRQTPLPTEPQPSLKQNTAAVGPMTGSAPRERPVAQTRNKFFEANAERQDRMLRAWERLTAEESAA